MYIEVCFAVFFLTAMVVFCICCGSCNCFWKCCSLLWNYHYNLFFIFVVSVLIFKYSTFNLPYFPLQKLWKKYHLLVSNQCMFVLFCFIFYLFIYFLEFHLVIFPLMHLAFIFFFYVSVRNRIFDSQQCHLNCFKLFVVINS